MADLGLGNPSIPSAINDAGQVVGDRNGRPFLWQDGVVTDLPGTSVADINNAGQVVGEVYTGEVGGFGLGVSHAFVWQNGVMTDLGSPLGYAIQPKAVNSFGQFVGSYSVVLNTGYGAAVGRPFFYDGSTFIPLPTPSTAYSFAADINDSGQIVGSNGQGPFIYHDGILTNLNRLIAPGSGVVLAGATSINNAGQVVGYTAGINPRAGLLTPSPHRPGSEVQVFLDGKELADETASVGFVSAGKVTRTFTVRNVGDDPLTLSGITLPAGFALVSGFSTVSLPTGHEATFSVRMASTALDSSAVSSPLPPTTATRARSTSPSRVRAPSCG
jgi:probable HAF family extracellular repeat protein